jgi:hypothetical protein
MRPIRKWRILLLVMFCAVAFLRPLLRGAAEILVTDRAATSETAVVILGGDRCFPIAAERLTHNEVSKVLLFEAKLGRLESLGVIPSREAIARRELVRAGVSDNRVFLVSGYLKSNWHGARLIGTWLRQHPNEHVSLLCDRFESRREAFILDCELEPSLRGRVSVAGLRDRRYDESNWWRSTPGIKAFFGAALHLASARLCGEESPRPALLSADAYEKAALQ